MNMTEQQRLAEEVLLLKKNNRNLSQYVNLLLATIEANEDGILVLDNKNRIVAFNQNFLIFWGINPSFIEQDSKHLLSLISRRLAKPVACDLNSKDSQKYDLLKLNSGRVLESYFQPQRSGGRIIGIVWGFRDITAKEKAKTQNVDRQSRSHIAQLTKRAIAIEKLSEIIEQAEQNSQKMAVMFINLDKFKTISNTLGHKTSDILLQRVSQRLRDCLREDNIIYHWEKDEFVILFPKINGQQEVNAIATKILEAFKLSFSIGGKLIYIRNHIGIAMFPQHGKNADILLKNADSALSQARQLKSNRYQYYNSALNTQAYKIFTIKNLLHTALEKQEISLYYQPVVDIVTGKIVKMEALLRWHNSQFGSIPNHVFIPLAEETGEIISIGKWVLETACKQVKDWQKMGLLPVKISVNLSSRQFEKPNFSATVANILERSELEPHYLELEIAENIAQQNIDLVKNTFSRLQRQGINICMDNFGKDCSSLLCLKEFPFSTLKIDRSLVKDLNSSSQDVAIINAILSLGRGLNLNVVAKGVETVATNNLLKKIGFKYIQGNLFSQPLPSAEATKLLQES